MHTTTQTYTRTDVRRVFECFHTDLRMLACRTQAMSLTHADEYGHDIRIMAEEECLEEVHIQLLDGQRNRVRVHEYRVEKNKSWDSQRPGVNRWPCLPNGELLVIVSCPDSGKVEQLKRSGRLIINWDPSQASTDYSCMKPSEGKMYASNGYGLRRNSFTI